MLCMYACLPVCTLLFGRLMEYYYVCSGAKQKELNFASPRDAFFGTHLRWKFLGEFLVHIVQPWPYCPVELEIPAVWIAFLRVYLVLRAFRDHSQVYQMRHDIRSRASIDVPMKSKVGLTVAFRLMFWDHPALLLMVALFFFGFIFTYIVYASERDMWIPIPVDNDLQRLEPINGRKYLDLDPLYQSQYTKTLFNSVKNCIWFIAVTGTTTGYGDMLPVTTAGRIISMITAIFGIMLASFSVGIITQVLSPSAFEARLLAVSKTKDLFRSRSDAAARLIQRTWRLYQYRYKRHSGLKPKRSILHVASNYFMKAPSQHFTSYKKVETKKSMSTLTPEKSNFGPASSAYGDSFRRPSFFHHTPEDSAEETRLFIMWCRARGHWAEIQDKVYQYEWAADQRNVHKHTKRLRKQVTTLAKRVESLEKDLRSGQMEILKLLRHGAASHSREVSTSQTVRAQLMPRQDSLEMALLQQKSQRS